MSADDLQLVGERVNNLKKIFNIREGWSREDDSLPGRILNEGLGDKVVEGIRLSKEELGMMIDGYYKARGWNENGLVPDDIVMKLDLDDVVVKTSVKS